MYNRSGQTSPVRLLIGHEARRQQRWRTTADPSDLPWLMFSVQLRRWLISTEAGRLTPPPFQPPHGIKARPHGIEPEGESKDTSSIPASLHLPCDIKHALLINSPCPGGTESATAQQQVGEVEFSSMSEPWTATAGRGRRRQQQYLRELVRDDAVLLVPFPRPASRGNGCEE